MTRQDFELGGTVSKIAESFTLWQNERGIIEISRDTLTIPIMLKGEQRGCVFHGDGRLLLDTLVETEKGAIGRPVEMDLDKLFLMLGDTDETQQRFAVAKGEDLKRMGYENEQEFVARAEHLLDGFFSRDMHCCRNFGGNRGFVFAFPNEVDELDILVAKGSKLVYKALGMVFVASRNNVVLKSPAEVVLSRRGKSLIIKR